MLRPVSVRELRQALADLPDHDPVLLAVDGQAAWLHTVAVDPGARTVGLYAGTSSPEVLDHITATTKDRP